METQGEKRRQRSPVRSTIHEIANQLTVLNLVGSSILARCPVGREPRLNRETEIFERSIMEVTRLMRELSDSLLAHDPAPARDGWPVDPGEVNAIRLVRSVSNN